MKRLHEPMLGGRETDKATHLHQRPRAAQIRLQMLWCSDAGVKRPAGDSEQIGESPEGTAERASSDARLVRDGAHRGGDTA
jgi:hypothetical protein